MYKGKNVTIYVEWEEGKKRKYLSKATQYEERLIARLLEVYRREGNLQLFERYAFFGNAFKVNLVAPIYFRYSRVCIDLVSGNIDTQTDAERERKFDKLNIKRYKVHVDSLKDEAFIDVLVRDVLEDVRTRTLAIKDKIRKRNEGFSQLKQVKTCGNCKFGYMDGEILRCAENYALGNVCVSDIKTKCRKHRFNNQ